MSTSTTLKQQSFASYSVLANRIVIQDPEQALAGASEDVLRGLIQCLADSYSFGAFAQNAHWNLDRTLAFKPLHELFGQLYDDSFDRVDELAERLRQLGMYAPADLSAFKTMAGLPTMIPPYSANDWVAGVLGALEVVKTDLLILQSACTAANDLQTQDMTIGYLQAVDKSLWMLRSSLE
jgi:starvation-inducible DNA-binding protein